MQALTNLRFAAMKALYGLQKLVFITYSSILYNLALVGGNQNFLNFTPTVRCNTTSATTTLVITVPVGSGDTCVGDDTEGRKRRAGWAAY